ncbi:hypothetical protein [Roseateles sp. BYS87W]|uniref:Uncharacterized protein n=1 Tax=Pelomonas baiyunensis TaxID=3299026 RepID=A0ABW7H0Y5_9BURK
MTTSRSLPCLPALAQPRRRLVGLTLAASLWLSACAVLGPEQRPYHAFEFGVAPGAGTVQHLRWHYSDITSLGEKPVAVGRNLPFVLRRQAMPVPEVFEASWQTADGQWRLARLPVRSVLKHRVEGHSLLFWVTAEGVRGEYITYTPRGDQTEVFAEVRATPVDEAAAKAVSAP